MLTKKFSHSRADATKSRSTKNDKIEKRLHINTKDNYILLQKNLSIKKTSAKEKLNKKDQQKRGNFDRKTIKCATE